MDPHCKILDEFSNNADIEPPGLFWNNLDSYIEVSLIEQQKFSKRT